MKIAAETIAAFVFETYVAQARERNQEVVMIPVRRVWKALDGEFPLGLIRGVLGSMRFRNTYHLGLVAIEGMTEEPHETYVFTFPGRLPRASDSIGH